MSTKWCKYCQKTLPAHAFHRRRASPDGLGLKCIACSKAYGAEYYKRPGVAEAAKKRASVWASLNKEKRKQICARDRRRSKPRQAAAARRRRQKNLERARIEGRLNAHRRKSAGRLQLQEWMLLLNLSRGHCVYCAKKKPLTLDHFDPIVSGGRTEWENVIPVCQSCNSSKNRSDGADWLFEKHGVQGLARALLFMSAKKSAQRHYRRLAARAPLVAIT